MMNYLKLSILITSILLAFSCGQTTVGKLNHTRPNVIFINVDDLGWKDVGFMDSDFFETPNIDQLAEQGMSFTKSYAGAANCAPSRACLMSGQTTSRHGIYTVGSSTRGNPKPRKLIPVRNNEILPDSTITMGEMFQMAGYKTATIGKWHLGEDAHTQGFDVNIAGSMQGNPGKDGYFSPYNVKFLKDGPKGEHLTDRLTTEALRFMAANKDSPFFLYLPYYSVHTPLMGKEELVEKYTAKIDAEEDKNPVYAAMVETVDTNVGRLIYGLDSLGIADNTMVVFTSDNGGIRAISRQTPLRAGKGSYYEGGLRVPCVIRWPGVVQPESINQTPISNLDFFPTFSEIAGANLPDKVLDGTSLVPLLNGNKLPKRSLFFHFPIYLQAYNQQLDDGRDSLFRTRPGAVIIDGNWKLHHYFEDDGLELYNLKEDVGERNNLARSNNDVAMNLLAKLKEWQSSVDAPIPTQTNPEYDSLYVPE